MEIRNLGDNYFVRLDKPDNHDRSIINQINVLVKLRPAHKDKKYSFIGNGKETGGAQGWGHVLPNTCEWGSLPGESPKAQERWQLMPHWSQEVN